MELIELDLSSRHYISFLENLYIESFPLSERRPIGKMLHLHKENAAFKIVIVTEDEAPIGFFTYWDLESFIFAEHFAILPDLRNKGYGRIAMELFLKEVTKPLILEVELPTTILSERRIGFYQRIGFRLWEHIQYQQPSYHTSDETTIPMKLMSCGDINVEQDLTDIRSKIYSVVYNC